MKRFIIYLFFSLFFSTLFSQNYEITTFTLRNRYYDASLDDVTLKLYFNEAYHSESAYHRFFDDIAVDNIWEHEKRVDIYFDLLIQISSMSHFESSEVLFAYQTFLYENLWFIEDEQFKNDLYEIISKMDFGKNYMQLNNNYEIFEKTWSVIDKLEAFSELIYVNEQLPFYKGFSRASKIFGTVTKTVDCIKRDKEIALAALIKRTFVNEFAKYNFHKIKRILLDNSGAYSDPALHEAIENVEAFYENNLNDESDSIMAEAVRDLRLNKVDWGISITRVFLQKKVLEATIAAIKKVTTISKCVKTLSIVNTFGIIAIEVTIQIIKDINAQVNNAQYSIIASTIFEWLYDYYNTNNTCSSAISVYYSAYLSAYYHRLAFDVNLISDLIHNWNDAEDDADYLKGQMSELVISSLNQICDALPPYVISFESINNEIIIKFNESINKNSIENNVQLFEGESILDIDVTLNDNELIIQSSSLQPSHNYLLIVKEKIKDLEGNNLDGDNDGIEFGDYNKSFTQNGLTVDFQVDNILVTEYSTIRFTNTSVYTNFSPSTYLWDFGDGTTSTIQNPTHTYPNAGVYDVSLTVSDGTNSVTETKTNFITVTAPNYGHDLRLYYPRIDKDWLTPGEDLEFYCDVKNVGKYAESDYILKFQLINISGQVIEEETEQGVAIPIGQLSPANSNRTLSIASGYPDDFYTFKATVVFPDDYAQGDNTQEFSVFIGNANPFQTYEMFSDNILLNKNQTYTLGGHTVKFTSHDSEKARVVVDGSNTYRDIYKSEFSFFDAYRFNLIYKGYFSSTEAAFVYAKPSSSVSFSPQTITIEAGKTGTFMVVSNEEDPTPNIDVTNEGGLDASIVQYWSTDAYTKGIPYTNVYFDITVPTNAERKLYEFWVKMTADGDFYQKLNIEVIDPQPDFDYSLSKNSITIGQGMSEQLTLDFTALNGFNENIVLSFTDIPTGVTITPSENNFSLPQTTQLTIDIDENFNAFDNYTIELNMVSGSKSKKQSLYINVIDNSKNFIEITDVQYIDKDSKLDSLEIFYNAQFDYDATSITSNWQYQIDGSNWVDIPSNQILNNGAREAGDTSIIWNIQDTPSLFSNKAKFRMKNKNGNDFLSILSSIGYQSGVELMSIVYGNGYLWVLDQQNAKIRKYSYDFSTKKVTYINALSIAIPLNEGNNMCYYNNKYYIIDWSLEQVFVYNTSWSRLKIINISNYWLSLFVMNDKLYVYDYSGVDRIIEVNDDLVPTGEFFSIPAGRPSDYTLFDGKSLWLGDRYSDDIYKLNEEYTSLAHLQLPVKVESGTLIDESTIAFAGTDDEVFICKFMNPYSFYSESPEFTINNSYQPVCDTIFVINSFKDSIISDALNLATFISDLDTPFEDLDLTLFVTIQSPKIRILPPCLIF